MFQQLQGAFVQGMQGVLQEGLRVQQRSAANTEKLELEVRTHPQSSVLPHPCTIACNVNLHYDQCMNDLQVRELRDTVSRLEGHIGGLTQLVEALCANTGALQQLQQQQAEEAAAAPVEDAFSLLKQVRASHCTAVPLLRCP